MAVLHIFFQRIENKNKIREFFQLNLCGEHNLNNENDKELQKGL